jgi:hypothetical protein
MYRIKSSGEIKTQGEIRKLHPNTSLPRVWDESICESLGIDPVFEGPQAVPTNPYQFSMRQGIEQINGKWYTKYVLGPIFVDNELGTAAEQEAAYRSRKDEEQAASIRATRDNKLAQTDWMGASDVTMSPEWAAYRQALRDVPSQEGFPWNVVWPTQPE